MADVEKLNINSTDYDIADAKALRNKDTAGSNSFIDTRAGTTTYPTNSAQQSIVIGNQAQIRYSGVHSGETIIGNNTYTLQGYCTIVGYQAHASMSNAVSIGFNAQTSGDGAISIGYNSQANANYGVTVGGSAVNSGLYSVAVGQQSQNSGGQFNTAVGTNARTQGSNYNTVLGAASNTGTSSSYNVICGSNSTIPNHVSYAASLGASANARSSYSVQLGSGNNYNYGTLQFRDWPLVDNNGKIYEERLPGSIKTATPGVPNLYDMDEDKLSEQAILYTGVTNSAYTNSQFYRGRVRYGYPHFACGWVDNDWLDSYNDVMIDQQKFFTKLAEVTKERIDNNDVANGLIGGDNAEQSIYLYYDADNDYYLFRFGSDSFEKAFNSTPDDITGLSFDDLADYGIYFRNFHKPEDLEGEYEVCDIYYYAPVYIDGYDWNDNPSYINYFKFLNNMNDGDWGIGYVIPNYNYWEFEVDGTNYVCPIIPKTYEWNGDEYDSVEFRWEWNSDDEEWIQYINGEDIGRSWTTELMYDTFGIKIDSGEESNIEYVGLTVRGGEQRYWQQFNPIDESKFATATAVSNLQSALNVDEENKMFRRFQSARNLDTMTTAGQYKVEAIGSTNLPTQASAARYFWLFVTNFANNNTEIRQVLIADHVTMTSGGGDYSRYAPNIFVRCKYNNIWSAWKPLLTDEASPWISGFDKTKKQMLVHNASNDTIVWEDVA